MKQLTFLLSLLIPIVTLGMHSQVSAQELDQSTSTCQVAWSRGFDAVRLNSVENPEFGMSVFLQQNDIAPTDMWSAYRSVSFANRCFLEAVCKTIDLGGNLAALDVPLATKNLLGGTIPGAFTACPTDTTIAEMLEAIAIDGLFQPEDMNACNFTQETAATESRAIRLDKVYITCRQHAMLESAVFDRVLRNKIMDDVTRKTYGYFSLGTLSLVEQLKQLQNDAGEMVTSFNNVINQLCTLAHPD